MAQPVASEELTQVKSPATHDDAAKPGLRRAGWMLPSIADVLFLALTCILLFSPGPSVLLRDADTGWHIRNGEQILQTHSIPRVDPFSATMAGHTWYSWEWLWDLSMGAVHHWAGLNGVVVVNALLIAFVFALLFRLILKRTSSFLTAAVLACVAAFASQIHILARPHLVSWLLTLLWLNVLYEYKRGRTRVLIFLPALMLLWVNLHGGFVIGFALLFLFGGAELWTLITAPLPERRHEAKRSILVLGATTLACGAVSLVNPYGYKLYSHVFGYLSSSFLMDHIAEFLSPNFHLSGERWFELFIFLPFVAAVVSRQKVKFVDLLVVLFAIHSALYAARNIPLAAIMIALAASPWIAGALGRLQETSGWLKRIGVGLAEFSADMTGMEKRFRGHLVAVAAALCLFAVAVHGNHVGSFNAFHARFDASRFPVSAASFLKTQPEETRIFTRDNWSGYLIYSLYPHHRLFFDDRHDFYGEVRMKDYGKVVNLGLGWQEVLKRWGVNWVLMDPDSSLSNALKISPDWTVVHDDGVAVLFARRETPAIPKGR